MKPILIPCITGTHNTQLPVALISPVKDRPLVFAEYMTIFDCRTYGLKLNSHIAPLDHYLWYCDLPQQVKGHTVVFVTPDCDWLPKNQIDQICLAWSKNGPEVKCLLVPNSIIAGSNNCTVIGHALQVKCMGPVHPKWTHSFSRNYQPIDGVTEYWTYDSLNHS